MLLLHYGDGDITTHALESTQETSNLLEAPPSECQECAVGGANLWRRSRPMLIECHMYLLINKVTFTVVVVRAICDTVNQRVELAYRRVVAFIRALLQAC